MRDELKRLKKAVREKCLDCSGGTPAEVALCEIADCPLFPFRVELWPSLFDAGAQNGEDGPRGQSHRPRPPDEEPDEENLSGKADAPGQFRLF